MNSSDIYVKTLLGEEAMTQRTRVVQRSQRMVLVLVDGKTRVAELCAKIGDTKLAETALKELEAGGFIALSGERASEPREVVQRPLATPSQLSQFSTFGPKSPRIAVNPNAETVMPSNFSSFGRPSPAKPAPALSREPEEVVEESDGAAPVKAPVPVAKVVLGALAAGVVALAGGVFLYPYDNHRPALETSLSQQLGQPVRIGKVGPRFLPEPMLELSNVRLGQDGQGHIDMIRLPGLWSHVRGQELDRNSVLEIRGAILPVELLQTWLVKPDPKAPARIKVQDLELLMGERTLAVLGGEILRTPEGALKQAVLQSSDRSFRLELAPQGKELGVNFEASSWKPQPESPVTFVFASAKGVLQGSSLSLNSVDLRFLDGRYEGDLLIDWGAGQGLAGRGTLHRVNVASLGGLWSSHLNMTGELSGSLRFRAQGKTPRELAANLEAEGSWRVERGEVRMIDLANAVRLGRGQVSKGGSTRFERLAADGRLSPAGLQLSNIQMEAGLMQGQGNLDVDASGNFRGRIGVSLARAGGGGANVTLSGRLPSLDASVQ